MRAAILRSSRRDCRVDVFARLATETNYQTMQLVSALDLAIKNRESRMRAIGGNLNMRSPRARTL